MAQSILWPAWHFIFVPLKIIDVALHQVWILVLLDLVVAKHNQIKLICYVHLFVHTVQRQSFSFYITWLLLLALVFTLCFLDTQFDYVSLNMSFKVQLNYGCLFLFSKYFQFCQIVKLGDENNKLKKGYLLMFNHNLTQ